LVPGWSASDSADLALRRIRDLLGGHDQSEGTSMTDDPTRPPGWYPDEGVDAPAGQLRYWDGSAWTEHTTAPTGPAHPVAVQQAPRNGLGIAALILGIIGVLSALVLGIIGVLSGLVPFFFWVAGILGIIGLFLGLIGYGRFQRSEASNGTTALWGIITNAVAAVVVSIVGAVILVGVFADLGGEASVETEGTASPAAETSAPAQADDETPTDAVYVDVANLEVGDCLAEPPPEDESSVPTVACSEPHSHEVFAAVTLPAGDSAGMDEVNTHADELCFAEFNRFVGLPYEESGLLLNIWIIETNTETVVVCMVYDPAGDTTGTLADANR
jgi:uncharacterized membrane protein